MLKKLFGFNSNETSVKTEILAGITTFLTMAYILAVNPNILSETGMDKGALFTTTVAMSAVATIFMGLYAKLPLALAPGMGLNAFFAYSVCMIMGYSWQFALTAVFLEGIVFILLTITNLREKIVDAIPDTLKNAISAGIGLYIAFIGLESSEIIVNKVHYGKNTYHISHIIVGYHCICHGGNIHSRLIILNYSFYTENYKGEYSNGIKLESIVKFVESRYIPKKHKEGRIQCSLF